MPKNEPKKVEISILSLREGISEKVVEYRPPLNSVVPNPKLSSSVSISVSVCPKV